MNRCKNHVRQFALLLMIDERHTMTDKACISCAQNARAKLYCEDCEKVGFIKSSFFTLILLLILIGSNEQKLNVDQPMILGALLLTSMTVAYYLRKVVSAIVYKVVFPTVIIISLIECIFVVEAQTWASHSAIKWHEAYLRNLPFFSMSILLITLKPLISKALTVEQSEYVKGKEKPKNQVNEDDGDGHDELLGL